MRVLLKALLIPGLALLPFSAAAAVKALWGSDDAGSIVAALLLLPCAWLIGAMMHSVLHSAKLSWRQWDRTSRRQE